MSPSRQKLFDDLEERKQKEGYLHAHSRRYKTIEVAYWGKNLKILEQHSIEVNTIHK